MDGDWGNGILQAERDRPIVEEFDEAFALRELRAKINGRAGIKEKYSPNRFSIQAESCYGTHSVAITRKWLDSGMLVEFLNSDFHKDNRCWNGEDGYRYTILAACVMALGCTLPKRMRADLVKMVHPAYQKLVKDKHPKWALKPLAVAQMKKAVANYKDGEPYNFGNKSFLESFMGNMFTGEVTVKDVGSNKIITTTQSNGRVIPQVIGPPSDEEMGQVPMYPAHACATCGASEKEDGDELLVCARCHDRKYCSKACQKKHWKKHKPICTRPAVEMESFLSSIPMNMEDDIKKAMETMKSPPDIHAPAGQTEVMIMGGGAAATSYKEARR